MKQQKRDRADPGGRKKKLASGLKNGFCSVSITETAELLSMLKTTVAELLRSKRLGTKNIVIHSISFIASLGKLGGD